MPTTTWLTLVALGISIAAGGYGFYRYRTLLARWKIQDESWQQEMRYWHRLGKVIDRLGDVLAANEPGNAGLYLRDISWEIDELSNEAKALSSPITLNVDRLAFHVASADNVLKVLEREFRRMQEEEEDDD